MIPPKNTIDEIDPEIAKWHKVWARNRAMIEGERTVKEGGAIYLSKEEGLSHKQHQNIIDETPFTPGASRTHQGLIGLIFRKSAAISCPDNIKPILETITADGYTLDDLAEDVVSETLITNFTGLLTDYPAAPAGLSLAKALEIGAAPQIALYVAEDILGIEVGKVNFRQRITRVRVKDNPDTIRELRLDEGVYSVTIHRKIGTEWAADEPIIPMKGGEALDEIPFSLITSNRKYLPAKAKLEDVCMINAQHYRASRNLALADYWVSHPTPYLFGVKVADLKLAPGTFISSEGDASKIRIGMLEYNGTSISQLAQRKTDLANDMVIYGSRILAPEKSAVEAGNTLSIKSATDNASTASTARLAQRWINDQLKWVSWWLDLEEDALGYELNTDYGLEKLSAQDRAQMVAEWQAGVFSFDTLIDQFIAGEALPETFDRELDAQRKAEEIADRPPVDTIPVVNDDSDPEESTDR